MRITILLGVREPGLEGALLPGAGAGACVRFFTLRFAIDDLIFRNAVVVVSLALERSYHSQIDTRRWEIFLISAKADARQALWFGKSRSGFFLDVRVNFCVADEIHLISNP